MTSAYDPGDFGFSESSLEKRAQLLSAGYQPYPYSFADPTPIGHLCRIAVTSEGAGEELPRGVRVAGRLWARRGMGKLVFCDLRDCSGKIQIMLSRHTLDAPSWEMLRSVEPGDILGAEGDVIRTSMGELTLRVATIHLLAKAVVPIPIGKEAGGEVYHRVSNPELHYRERYLHWMLHEQDRERIRQRSHIISAVRRIMEQRGFLEVATPTVEMVYGGAEARPFQTEIWALGHQRAYLRISPELYLKRYVVAGFERVFTICQNFRNEGIDHSHNPEFTMMEWYEAYTDYTTQMDRFETLVAEVAREVRGTTRIAYQGQEIELAPPWRRMSMLEALRELAGLDADRMTAADLRGELGRREVPIQGEPTWGQLVAVAFGALCEHSLVQPTFITDHPVDISPLTKRKRGDARLVERFEPYICRMEVGNAYSELTDPVEQLERLLAQRDLGAVDADEADFENHPVDKDFVKAIGCGMPPTGGVGLGIDRLIMLLTDAPSIRDIIPFPMVKPRREG